jgi:hypothetical protein
MALTLNSSSSPWLNKTAKCDISAPLTYTRYTVNTDGTYVLFGADIEGHNMRLTMKIDPAIAIPIAENITKFAKYLLGKVDAANSTD